MSGKTPMLLHCLWSWIFSLHPFLSSFFHSFLPHSLLRLLSFILTIVLEMVTYSAPFYSWIIFYCVNIHRMQAVFPFTHWWPFGYLPSLDNCGRGLLLISLHVYQFGYSHLADEKPHALWLFHPIGFMHEVLAISVCGVSSVIFVQWQNHLTKLFLNPTLAVKQQMTKLVFNYYLHNLRMEPPVIQSLCG